MENVRRMYGECMENVWRMYGECMENVRRECMENVRKISKPSYKGANCQVVIRLITNTIFIGT